jgi:hypothetical protein
MSETEWLTRKQASLYLTDLGYNISPKSLSNLASNNNAKGGPSFTRIGWRAVRYRREDVRKWFEARVERVA